MIHTLSKDGVTLAPARSYARDFWRDARLENDFRYMRRLTEKNARSFYLAARFLPERKRWATYAVYGFCRYADNIIDNPRDRSIDELRHELECLRVELRTAFRTGESEHPILRPFVATASIFGIPLEYALELIEGVEMDLLYDRYQTFDDLYLFCYRVAAVVGLMMTYVLGTNNPAAFCYAEQLGIAMQLTNILRDVQEDKNMGRIYLPREELCQFGVTERDIIEENITPEVRELLRYQAERARNYYKESMPGVRMLDSDARFTIYAAANIYGEILERLSQRDYNPFLGRVVVPTRQKSMILLREVLRSRFDRA